MLAPPQDVLDPQQSWLGWLFAGGVIAGLVVILWLINRLLPETMRKGYSAAAGNALMRAETFFRPSREHVIEAKRQERKEEEGEGDSEHPGAN